ncbi:hypothetical protein PMAYCL1PPCAC_04425, partial [Pristionchus mayeri]
KLAELRDNLTNLGTMPFITGGTLLGWYRECAIIPHTSDADFGILRQEYRNSRTEMLDCFVNYQKIGNFIQDYDSLEFTLVANGGGSIDIFIFYDQNDTHVYTAGLDKESHNRYKWIQPKANGYCSGILYDHLFFVPCNVLEILIVEYGKNWEIDQPTSEFKWWESSPNAAPNGKLT